ncbi:MAG: UvrD-helicase domain-containing protein, partial [Afipia sp.]|nr:UvrD-helicase domain-containing protein [Afipia sp.]
MPLTVPDQQARNRCVTDLDSNLVIEAAAGTGKTTLMSCRVAMLLAEGREPSTIAAITFTEASATDLGKRIHGIVDELLADRVPPELRAALPTSLSADQKQALTAAADQLNELTTTTIHSFCQQIIVDNAVEAGLDPGIKVADEMAADAMFDQAFSDWLTKALSSGSAIDRPVVVLAEDDPTDVERQLRDLAKVRRQYRRAAPPTPNLSLRPDIDLTDAIDAFARWVANHPFDKRTNDLADEFDRLRVHYDGTLAGDVEFDTLWRMAHPPRIFAMKWRSFDFEAYQRLGAWKKAQGEDGVRLNDEVTALYDAPK